MGSVDRQARGCSTESLHPATTLAELNFALRATTTDLEDRLFVQKE